MNRTHTLIATIILLAIALSGCGAPAASPATGTAAEESAAAAPVAEESTAITETAALTETAAGSDVATTTNTAATTDTVTTTGTVATTDTVTTTDAATQVRGERTFVIIPSESTASYIADEEFFADALSKYGINAGKQDTIGSTQEISGRLTLNLDDLSQALGENTFTVMLNTLASDQSMRDNYIRSEGPRFNQFPEATFVATSIEGAPATYTDGDEVNFKLIGDITIRDITAPATFDVAARLTGDILTGVAETTLKMSDFGIEPLSFLMTLTVADEIGVKVEFTAQAE